MAASRDFRSILASGRVLVCDGAMGTMLQKAGVDLGQAPEALNVDRPAAVEEIHRRYVAAGADIITTNTFGGSQTKLARAGLAGRAAELNRAGASLARAVAGETVFVAGSIGPTGELLEPYGDLKVTEAEAAFAGQAAALAAGGVDLFLVETMSDLAEVKAAVAGIGSASDLPILCTLSFDAGGRTMMGVSPRQAAEALSALEIDGFGANCGQGPEEMEAVVHELLATRPGAVVIAQPNAGLPVMVDGWTEYDATPERMAEYAWRYVAAGVRIVGSCCGSTPEHTAAIARRVRLG